MSQQIQTLNSRLFGDGSADCITEKSVWSCTYEAKSYGHNYCPFPFFLNFPFSLGLKSTAMLDILPPTTELKITQVMVGYNPNDFELCCDDQRRISLTFSKREKR